MAARRALGKRLRALLAVAVVVVAVPACSVVRGTISTTEALDDAGFSIRPGDIDAADGDAWVVRVRKDTEDLTAAAVEAAGIVWRELPVRIERLEVTCGNGFGGRGTFAADRAELEQRFGPRDPDLDRGVEDDDLRTLALVLVGLLVVGVLALAGLVVLVVVLVRRSRRRNPPPGPWGPGGPGGPAGPYGPPGAPGEVSQPPPPRYGPSP
jgi:hypothetical protein